MKTSADAPEFRKSLNELRSQGHRPSPVEVAELAIECGLSRREALLLAQRETPFDNPRNKEVFDALTAFVAELCSNTSDKEVLEFAERFSFMSEPFIDRAEHSVTVVSRRVEVTEVANLVFGSEKIGVTSVGDLKPSYKFDCIFCQPPIGQRSTKTDADGFGGEVVSALETFVSAEGRLLWLTSRGVLKAQAAKTTFSALERQGLHVAATIDIPAGGFPGTSIEGVLIVLERRMLSNKLVGALRDEEAASPMASALLKGASKKSGSSWAWIERDSTHSYADLENAALLKKLMPRGRYELVMLGDLIGTAKITKADKPLTEDSEETGFIYVPEYAGSRVTTDPESLTVKPKAVYRIPLDTCQVNPRFIATLLNSPYGRKLRASAAQGATIQRVSVASLKSLTLPLPNLSTQENISHIESDLALLASSFNEIQDTITHNWAGLSDVNRTVEKLKSVLNIERQIENWWQELPYPLATIYRRYQIATDPKERLDRLLHFFEMASVYLAAVGTSHVKALRPDWRENVAKWFHPSGSAGIERADFGFWIALAGASLKDLSRIASDQKLRDAASDRSGPELIEVASTLGPLSKTTVILDRVRRYRNNWKGHGGHLKGSDAEKLDNELQQSIRDFYEATARIFRQLLLIMPGLAEITDDGMTVKIQKLSGSDPAFDTEVVDLKRPTRSGALAFWMIGAQDMCRTLPFFRLGAPKEPQETSFYVFNRVENGGFRWISYQEAREQEFVAPDDELFSLIDLSKGDNK